MKQLKIVIYCLGILICSPAISGQENNPNEEAKQIGLEVIKPVGTNIQENVVTLLKEHISQAVILNGVASTHSRFILTTRISELSSQVTPSAPPRYVSEFEVACYITDRSRQAILQQTTFQVKGVAGSKEKAVQNAINSIQARHPRLKQLITKGKEKIAAYYLTDIQEKDSLLNKQVTP